MATLLVNLPANADTIGVSLSAALGTAGDEAATITVGAETMNVISGIGTRELVVDRGATPAVHANGTSVTYLAGSVTGSPVSTTVTGPDNFGASAVVGASGKYSDGAHNHGLLTPTVRVAAGVPSGAPTTTELPIAVDSTASTGGIYIWHGSAWTKYASIP